MSISTQKSKDQAEELRKAVEEVNNEVPMETENKDTTEPKLKNDEFEMDILNLPPRKDVHKNAKGIRIKINASFIRFIIVIIFILFIIGGVIWLN